MNPLLWTAIIPAAGRSTRFNSKKNKILYKFKNKTILEHIISKVLNYCSMILLIVSQKDLKEFKKIIKKKKIKKIKFLVQKEINGMATAVNLGIEHTKTIFAFILWGDQLGLSKITIKNSINFKEKNKFVVNLPIVYSKKPYTLVKFDKKYYLKKIYQSREENLTKTIGFSDCGFFCCEVKYIKKKLNNFIKQKKIITKKTKEYDFLKALNLIARKRKIKVLKSKNTKDSIGVNFKHDLNLL